MYGRGGDVFAVKIQTPGKLFFVGSILVALAGCATSSTRESAPVVSMGSSTYSVTRQANNGFTRDTEKLKAEAKEDAAKFCADHGKQMKIVAVTEDKPLYTLGYATAKVIFKALDAGDPELAAPAMNLARSPL